MNILYEKENATDQAEKVADASVPLSQNLVQTSQDDDPSKIEGMMMEDPNIPLNLRLVHIETKEGDELIKIEWRDSKEFMTNRSGFCWPQAIKIIII